MEFHIAKPENDEGAQWRKKGDESRFLTARNGDMLCAPFQCDFCWFINLQEREPEKSRSSDEQLMKYIRRVNLDILWCREKSTVSNVMGTVKNGKKMSEEVGLRPKKLVMGPWPLKDNQGFQIAIEILRRSQGEGRNDKTYVQFDSLRKLRGAYFNIYQAGPEHAELVTTLKGEHGKSYSLANGETESYLFKSFTKGCERRMGRLVMQDRGVSIDMLKSILIDYEDELRLEVVSFERKREILVAAGAFVILFGGALRGGEIFLLEASELIKRVHQGKVGEKHSGAAQPHVVVPLMGRFKGETGERNVLLALASKTKSGLEIRKWIERLVWVLKREGREEYVGPAICRPDGVVLERWKLNGELQKVLEKVALKRPDLIEEGVKIEEKFSIHRSFRRGAHTRAKSAGVSEAVLEMNNRWRKIENKSGGLPNLPMTELYIEITQALSQKLAFSSAL